MFMTAHRYIGDAMKNGSVVLALLFTSLLATVAAGQTLTVGSVNVQCGKTVTVPVSISNTSGLLALQFKIAYDASKLTPTKVVAGTLTSEFSLASNIESNPISVAMASGTAVNGSGRVAMISFTTNGSASASTVVSVSEALVNDVPKNGNDGTITITCLQPPSQPTLVSPADGATNVTAPVKLQWNASANADSYRVYFGSASPQLIETTSSTSLDVSTAQGTTYSWYVRAVNGAGSSDPSATRTFTTSGSFCDTPTAPEITVPATVASGVPFEVKWSAVASATDYVVEESQNASFPGASSTVTTVPTVAFTKSTLTTFYYRVKARNTSNGCNVNGPYSGTAAVTITATPPIPLGSAVLAAVGSSPGGFGSMFRTSIQLYNHTNGRLRGNIVYHPTGTTGSDRDPSLSYDLAPGETRSFLDLLPAMGIASGLGSADLVPSPLGSALPLFVTRIYNDGGVNGTAGMTLDASTLADALFAGQRGVIIAPMDPARARMNVGVRTLGDGAAFTVTMRDKAGQIIASRNLAYAATFFVQTSAEQLVGSPLTPDATLTFSVQSGSVLIYASATDNTTQDTSIQIARPLPTN